MSLLKMNASAGEGGTHKRKQTSGRAGRRARRAAPTLHDPLKGLPPIRPPRQVVRRSATTRRSIGDLVHWVPGERGGAAPAGRAHGNALRLPGSGAAMGAAFGALLRYSRRELPHGEAGGGRA